MECVLWTREKSLSKEKSGFYQHVAIAKAITPQWLPRAPQSTPNGPPERPNRPPVCAQSAPVDPQWVHRAPWEAIGG